MAGLQNLLEDYRNWTGLQDWKYKKQLEQMFGGDPESQEDFEKLSSGFGPSNIGSGLSGLAGAIKTYHGSPRAEPFSKFSKEFMGSGEGAQAFGKGHYTAERPGIAKGYSEMSGPMYEKELDTSNLSEDTAILLSSIKHWDFGSKKPEDIIKNAKDYAKTMAGQERSEFWHNIYDELNNVPMITKGPTRSLYEVSLEWPGTREATDPLSREHFFQWDKDFRNQPEHVKSALMDIINQYPDVAAPYAERLAKARSPGWDTKKLLTTHPGITIRESRGAIEPLMYERGIPGVAFLDQPSRTKPVNQRTYNYVSFGDEIPRIVSHNDPGLLKMLWPEYNK